VSTTLLRLGTRASRLARIQAALARDALVMAGLTTPIGIVEISTRGDAISARRPHGDWAATDGQFTSELEHALLNHGVDLVVHSYKDLPTALTPGLAIAAVLERADARDCLVSRWPGGVAGLPFGARIGTSSPRRAAQLTGSRRDLLAVPMRGNVESRLARLEDGEFDAIVLAAAGLDRLGVRVADDARLPYEQVLPAPAQAALAIQVRADDDALRERVRAADHQPTRIAVEAERALLRRIGGGCLAPLGAFGEVTGGRLRLRAAYEAGDGRLVHAKASGEARDAAVVVEHVARELLRRTEVPA
jgi:hydroxymethylbilane synthase